MSLNEVKSLIKDWKLDEAQDKLETFGLEQVEAKYLRIAIYFKKGIYDEALKLAYETLEQAEAEDNFKIQSKVRMSISYTLWWLGNIDELDNFLKETEIIYHQIPESERRVRLYWQNFLHSGMGMVLWRRGKHESAIQQLEKSLELSERLQEDNVKALSTYIIGLIHQSQGRLQEAEVKIMTSLQLYRQVNSKIGIVYGTISLGINYYNKGRLDTALDYFLEALDIHERLQNKQYVAYCYDNIGLVYQSMANPEKAYYYLKKGLVIRREIGNDFDTAISHFNLISYGLRHNEMQEVEQSLNELKLIAEINENPLLQLRAELAEAMFYKQKKRFTYIIKAKDILSNIISRQVISYELTIETMLQYCEVLLMELKVSEDPNIISEITALLHSMQSMAELYQSYRILIEVIILQSKLALIDGGIEDAQNLLDQARILSRERGLTQLEEKVEIELEELQSQFLEWKQRVEENASIIDKLEVSSIMDYLGTISTVDLNSNVPDNYGEMVRVKKNQG